MASGKSLVESVLGRFLFKDVHTSAITDLADGFRLIQFGGSSLTNVAWEAGDKIQIYLPGKGMRTYTPMAWDAARGTAELLVYVHGSSPGAAWGKGLSASDTWQFFGPRRSIRAGDLANDVVLFGDETSFAVARALGEAKRANGRVRCVFEVNDARAAEDALSKLGLTESVSFERRSADAHLSEVAEALTAALAARADASLVMTGKAQSIQTLRARLKERGALRGGKVKAYWSVGKTGLD